MEYQDIQYAKQDGIATVTINRPRSYNAFRAQTCEEMIDAFKDADFDKSIGVVVLTGAGDKAFCNGGGNVLVTLCDLAIASENALQMGLVNAVVPQDQLDVEVKKWCDEILEKSPTDIALAKKSFNIDTEIIRGIGGLAMHALKLYYETPESAEGGNAFREKRKPAFCKHVK